MNEILLNRVFDDDITELKMGKNVNGVVDVLFHCRALVRPSSVTVGRGCGLSLVLCFLGIGGH